MSKYMSFESEVFANEELLIEALRRSGFEKVTVGKDIPLEGWDKSDNRTADIIIRRRDFKEQRLLGDIGFQKTAKGFVAVIDDMDLDYRLGRDFVKRLQTQYHEATAIKMAKKLGGTILREQIGKTIKIRIRY
jgi:Protein of unknown function (DUF1257)